MNDVQEKTSGELVSIIILFHNSAQYVEESVRSVMAQTYQNRELLFMDDNSKDNTITLMMDLKDEAKIRREDYPSGTVGMGLRSGLIMLSGCKAHG